VVLGKPIKKTMLLKYERTNPLSKMHVEVFTNDRFEDVVDDLKENGATLTEFRCIYCGLNIVIIDMKPIKNICPMCFIHLN